MKNIIFGVVVAASLVSPSVADEVFFKEPPTRNNFVFDFGARDWYSSGNNHYNYYTNPTPTAMISRLTYSGLSANSGELYFRAEHTSGIFVKGNIGAGNIFSGSLNDEDFFFPYSSTQSEQRNGKLQYFTIDVGYDFYGSDLSTIGFFGGYNHWYEENSAYGCTQTAANPFVCVPSIPNSALGITNGFIWNSIRVGLTTDIRLGDPLLLTFEAAYIRGTLSEPDTHYFTFGFDPASGNGTNGFQTEAVLKYQFIGWMNIGIGGRWWHATGQAVDSFNQLLKVTSDRYGVFAQVGFTFDTASKSR